MKLGQSYTNGTITERFFHSSFQETLYEVLRSGNVRLAMVAAPNPTRRVIKFEAATFVLP